MFFLGFEGLILAKLAALAAAKISHDVVQDEAARTNTRFVPQPQYRHPQQPAGQPHYAGQFNSYDPCAVYLERAANGCFHARCVIDDQPAFMMIDSGSSGVVIGHRLARRLGFDLASATYDLPVRTGGSNISYACRFTLPEINVEGHIGRNVDSIVHQHQSATEDVVDGLVGQSFLRQVRMQQDGDTLILRPRR